MASQQAIATKTVNAVRTIEKASAALAKTLKIEITAFPVVPKRYAGDYAQAVQLAHLADVLQKIALATKAAKEKDFEAPDPVVEEAPEAAEEVLEEVIEKPKIKVIKKSATPKGKKK